MKREIMNAPNGFSWEKNFSSFCDAPVKIIDADLIDEAHPARQFQNYWLKLGAGSVPDRSKFSPVDVKFALKWLMLFRKEIQDSENLFKLFLIGASALEMSVHARQGQYLHEFTVADCYDTRKALMEHVLAAGQPGFAKINVTPHSEFRTRVLVGMFPFRDGDGEQVFVVPAPENKSIRALM